MRIRTNREPKNGWCWAPADVDDMPLDMLFSQAEIEAKREEMRKALKKHMDKMYKARFGDAF